MSRTRAEFGGRTHSGEDCSGCGTSYARCTARVLAQQGACCSDCMYADTHDERVEIEHPTGYAQRVRTLLAHGWVLRCGHCSRRLNTDHAPRVHWVLDDLSGRCYMSQPEVHHVSTRFFADPDESLTVRTSPCPDCEGKGRIGDAMCATCEASFRYDITPEGGVRLVRTDLPGIADEDKFAITLSEHDLVDILLALRRENLGADTAGNL